MSDSKVFVMPEAASSGNNLDPNLMMSMMNNGGFGGNNNFIWLLFLFMLYGNRGFNNGSGIDNLINADTGKQWLMDAINGNSAAISTLSTALGKNTGEINTAIAGVKGAIDNVAGTVNLSSQQVINAIQQGNMQLGQQICNCCCQTREAITKGNYENQIATLNQTNTLMSRIDQFANGVQQGFSQIGFQMATDKCEIKQATFDSTQRIIDALNNHWTSELSQKYQDAKLELSQLNQNATLIAALKTT